MSAGAYTEKGRSWFLAWVNKSLGDTHLAKEILQSGCDNTHLVERFVQASRLVEERLSKRHATAPIRRPRSKWGLVDDTDI